MKTVIIYASKHGSTAQAAQIIKDGIGNADLINIKSNKNPDISRFDAVIIGASIHLGKIPKEISAFCSTNQGILLNKRLGLFLCCMYKDETAQKQFEDAFSSELRQSASAAKVLGGEFLFEKMNFLEKIMIKKIKGDSVSVSEFDQTAIDEFISLMIK